MQRAPSLESFLEDPIGRWVAPTPISVVHCATSSLCGAIGWGRPSPAETMRTLEAFGVFRHPKVERQFDVVLDCRAIEGLDPDTLGLFVNWIAERRIELAARVRIQWGVIADNLVGITMTGILPVLGDTHAFRVVRDEREAFRALAPDGDVLCDELAAAVSSVRAQPPELRALRDLLRARPSGIAIADAARTLSVSVRTLQRVLHESGTTFSAEAREARYSVAHELLVHGTEKIATVARRVGLSEKALTQLVRERTELTPAALRAAKR